MLYETFLSDIPAEIQHVLSAICLYMNWKAHVACDFNCLFENEGLLKVTASHVHCKCGNLYIIIGLWRCHTTRVAYVDVQAAGGECRPAAGRNRGLGRRRASQNRDVTPAAWLTRAEGRAGGYKQSRRRAAWRLVSCKRRQIESLLLQSTNRNCYMAYWIEAIPMTLSHLRFQAGCRRRRLNLALVFCVLILC